jgi:glyoxylase-like metal-dependent hydrolase (beta-lactamase superfamily II)
MAQDSLVRLARNTWLVPGPTNIGLVETASGAWLVDSGNDKESGRKLLRILRERGLTLRGIVNTHSNADHTGGNAYLQGMTGCGIYATEIESAFIRTPTLESGMLWGGFPVKELRSKFFEAKPSNVTGIVSESSCLEGLRFIPLPGHYLGQIGVMTDDGVLFLGDSLFGERVLEKYKVPFVYDVKAFKASAELIRGTAAELYVPSHGEITTDIGPMIDRNLAAIHRIEETLREILVSKKPFELVLSELCDRFGVRLDCAQYALIGSTVRSFLSYLHYEGRAEYRFENNTMFWTAVPGR